MSYNPRDHYWVIADDKSRVFSSASKTFVSEVPKDRDVTRIASENELWDVLRQQAPECLPDGVSTSPTETENLRSEFDALGVLRKTAVTEDDITPLTKTAVRAR